MTNIRFDVIEAAVERPALQRGYDDTTPRWLRPIPREIASDPAHTLRARLRAVADAAGWAANVAPVDLADRVDRQLLEALLLEMSRELEAARRIIQQQNGGA